MEDWGDTMLRKKRNWFFSFINGIEKVGNHIPHPFFLFMVLCGIVLALSFIFGTMGMSVTYLAAEENGNGLVEKTVFVENLLQRGYLQNLICNFVEIYVTFSPLGLVMVMMIAVGFLQETGFFDALMKKTLMNAPAYLVTFILGIVGVCANIASNAGIVFAATIGAALFAALGRNPILGAVAGYCAGHGGFSANLIISGTDTLLGGITESAAKSMNIPFINQPMINYFFMVAATLVIAFCVTVVTELILPKYVKTGWSYKTDSQDIRTEMLSAAEEKGLKRSGIAFLLCVAGILWCVIPSDGFLRNDNGMLLPNSPFTDGLVFVLFIVFVVVAVVYGKSAGVLKKNSDIPKFMEKGLKGSLSFLIVSLPAAYFIQFFNDSKLATILAVTGGKLLQKMNLSGIPLAIAFVLLVSLLNMFMTSGSAKWLILAPIFVPMFSVVNFSPAFTQLLYRIGDSVTNPISPVNFFLPVIIGLMEQYRGKNEPEVRLGTLFSMTVPYSISFLIALIVLLVGWMILGLPIGPGTSILL